MEVANMIQHYSAALWIVAESGIKEQTEQSSLMVNVQAERVP
jgi:hypothetical protein